MLQTLPGGSWIRAARRVVGAAWVALVVSAALATAETAPSPEGVRLAIFPIDNLAARPAPLGGMRETLRKALSGAGIPLVDESALREFMARERVRYVGGISSTTGQRLWGETGANLVLITHLVQFDDAEPPRMDFLARLVEISGPHARILWATSVPLAGDDSPGFLGLGLVNDPALLLERALSRVTDGLLDFLLGRKGRDARAETGARRARRPRSFYRAPESPRLAASGTRVAVLPFSNDSLRRRAGEILGLRFVHSLVARGIDDVVEPADVRAAILETRLIQEGGLSLPQADLLKTMLDVQLVFTGTVFDYLEPGGFDAVPELAITAIGIDAEQRRLGWIAFCYDRGDDGVAFFDMNLTRTVGGVTDEAVLGLLERLEAP